MMSVRPIVIDPICARSLTRRESRIVLTTYHVCVFLNRSDCIDAFTYCHVTQTLANEYADPEAEVARAKTRAKKKAKAKKREEDEWIVNESTDDSDAKSKPRKKKKGSTCRLLLFLSLVLTS